MIIFGRKNEEISFNSVGHCGSIISATVCNVLAVSERIAGEKMSAMMKTRVRTFTGLILLRRDIFKSVVYHNATHSIRLVHTDDAHNHQQSYNHRARNPHTKHQT